MSDNTIYFQVGTKLFPAHIFIIASSSEFLYKLYKDACANPGDKPQIALENVHPEAFDRVMRYMYTGTCDVAELGPCALKIRKEELVAKKEKENIEVEEETIGKWVFFSRRARWE